jgi:hypothetical protein
MYKKRVGGARILDCYARISCEIKFMVELRWALSEIPMKKNLFFPGQGAKFSLKKKFVFVLEKMAKLRVCNESMRMGIKLRAKNHQSVGLSFHSSVSWERGMGLRVEIKASKINRGSDL